jgi:3-hydroxypropanoate dehydrogenase
MTQTHDAPTTLAPEFEAEFDRHLELDKDAQDLLFRAARTANTFTDEPVTEEQVRAIYDLVKWAPTSMNIQPLRIVLVRSPEARGRLVEHMGGNNKAKTSTAPLVAILAADTDFHDELGKVFPHFPGARDIFAGNDEMREGSARLNATLQLAYFILGIRAAGLAAGPMTGFDAAGVDREFFADGAHRTIAVVNIGRPGPDAWFDRLPRLEYDEVVTTV